MADLDRFNRSSCRSCDAPMVWARTKNDKLTPLDLNPSAEGNIVLTAATDPNGNPVVRHLTRGEMTSHGGDRYTSHFSTCPESQEWRKR